MQLISNIYIVHICIVYSMFITTQHSLIFLYSSEIKYAAEGVLLSYTLGYRLLVLFPLSVTKYRNSLTPHIGLCIQHNDSYLWWLRLHYCLHGTVKQVMDVPLL